MCILRITRVTEELYIVFFSRYTNRFKCRIQRSVKNVSCPPPPNTPMFRLYLTKRVTTRNFAAMSFERYAVFAQHGRRRPRNFLSANR